MCGNHPNIPDIPETEQPFRFVLFEEFPWVCYCWWEDRTYCLSCDLFGHKNEGKSLQKTYQKWKTAVKTFKKHKDVPTETHKKRQKLFHRFSGEYTLFVIPRLLLKGEG